jgi:proteic killer suppression protein
VIRSFADQATADVYVGRDSKPARRIPKPLWPAVRRKLDAVHRARSVQDLRWPSGNRLEPLRGKRAGDWSLRVNDQYRITFHFEDGHADEVACEDYH